MRHGYNILFMLLYLLSFFIWQVKWQVKTTQFFLEISFTSLKTIYFLLFRKTLNDNLSHDLLHATNTIYNPSKIEIVSTAGGIGVQSFEDMDSSFQYVLTAPTSIATKVGEPSLTYINQGQSYELKMKKLGDLSSHYKKKWLRSTIRICFHERR